MVGDIQRLRPNLVLGYRRIPVCFLVAVGMVSAVVDAHHRYVTLWSPPEILLKGQHWSVSRACAMAPGKTYLVFDTTLIRNRLGTQGKPTGLRWAPDSAGFSTGTGVTRTIRFRKRHKFACTIPEQNALKCSGMDYGYLRALPIIPASASAAPPTKSPKYPMMKVLVGDAAVVLVGLGIENLLMKMKRVIGGGSTTLSGGCPSPRESRLCSPE